MTTYQNPTWVAARLRAQAGAVSRRLVAVHAQVILKYNEYRARQMDTTIVASAIKLATEFVKRQGAASRQDIHAVRAEIRRHMTEALNWSNRIQIYGMSRADETDLATISLRLASEPRRFRAKQADKTESEDTLLSDGRNYLLLGDPGAGKTTTLKRLTRKLLLEPPVDANDIYQFPIIIRLRQLSGDETIVNAIASALGFPISERTDRKTNERTLYVADTPLADVVVEFLNMAHVVLLLDGLDEVPIEAQRRIRREVSWLALNSSDSKVIASCRSGDYTAVLEGFDLVEVCPLEPDEVAKLAGTWLDDPKHFLAQVAAVPYHDVADRPLLLTQLLYFYKRYGYLPEQPSQVYRRVIGLLLQEWDAEREIQRQSKYAGFDPDRKAAFLAALAYYLTYRIKRKVFSDAEMRSAYQMIHDRFGLPQCEAGQVMAEVETHTGIIAVAGPHTFEFAHLSIQEYLCAEYMVREPLAEHFGDYLAAYPAPVAIAVALSSNPSNSFAAVMLAGTGLPLESIHSFLTRLLLERPMFGRSQILGAVIGLLLSPAFRETVLKEPLTELLKLSNVAESIALALNRYFVVRDPDELWKGYVRLALHESNETSSKLRFPDSIFVPLSILKPLAKAGNGAASRILSRVQADKGA